MVLTSSMENYLKAVFTLRQTHGRVRCIHIAERMDVTLPSVSRAVKELSKSGHIMKTANGTLSLTEQGLQLAEQIYEKHRFFTKQLIDAGVDPKTAESDACRIEHVISKETFERLKAARKLSEKAVISSDES